MLCFVELQTRLIARLRNKVRSGETTERGLARLIGISQPHIHNVLKGDKLFSLDMSDRVLQELHLDLLDFIEPSEIEEKIRRAAS
jgi:hypothetical protein